ncbi:hypothetical protein AAHE18_06G100300 [Arachis hypogaea]
MLRRTFFTSMMLIFFFFLLLLFLFPFSFTLPLNSTTNTLSSSPLNDDFTPLTSIPTSFNALIKSSNNPSLFIHSTSNKISPSITETSTALSFLFFPLLRRLSSSSSFFTFSCNCFTYSIVSPNIEALSIFVTYGTNDLNVMNFSFSFSRRRRSAATWLLIRSSCGEGIIVLSNCSRVCAELWRFCLRCKYGTLNNMFLRSRWGFSTTVTWLQL